MTVFVRKRKELLGSDDCLCQKALVGSYWGLMTVFVRKRKELLGSDDCLCQKA